MLVGDHCSHHQLEDRVTEFEWTALHVAAAYNSATCVSVLLHFGADPDLRDIDGDTALITAASLGHTEVVQQLLTRADVMQTTLNGETALHVAAEAEFDDIVSLLLPRGGVKLVDALTCSGHTARDIALAKGRTETIALIDEFHKHAATDGSSLSRLQQATVTHQ